MHEANIAVDDPQTHQGLDVVKSDGQVHHKEFELFLQNHKSVTVFKKKHVTKEWTITKRKQTIEKPKKKS